VSRRRRLLLAGGSVFALLWGLNSPFLARGTRPEPLLLAHRALGQDYSREDLDAETCTASRMLPPEHGWLENTIPSIEAAFGYGADVVEIDVHPTTDGEFAVFHDWTVDCRTEGHGVTREHTLAELKALDVGYGYTADGGRTFPFRGTGVGLMPSLDEVLASFPGRRFLINVKSDDPAEGVALAERLAALPPDRRHDLMVYGGARPIGVLRRRLPDVSVMSRPILKSCLVRYLALGWSGHVPEACRNSVVLVPANVAPWLWGWPDRFVGRMEAAGSPVFLVNDWSGGFSEGINSLEDLEAKVPPSFPGGIWTDRIDRIGPAVAGPRR
jgi:glycerophosphoryl diester phosphodiesterase